ncbi:MAG: hypothetical protein M3Z24_10530 [Chloroflexota bacterium]|nr:hypothetical protein [Chloroflexota bacterium]
MSEHISQHLIGATPQGYPIYQIVVRDESQARACYITELPSGVELVSQVRPYSEEPLAKQEVRH